MRLFPHSPDPIVRLRIHPVQPTEGPAAIETDRPRANGQASRRPHNDTRVDSVRHYIEKTTLTYSQIAAKTGVARASICRWTRDQKWQRPVFAPRATDTVPSARNGQKLKLRLLAERLLALTERYVRELEAAPHVEVETLVHALEVLKMARTKAQGRNRRRTRWPRDAVTGNELISREQAIKTVLKEMRRGGVYMDRAPAEAVKLVLDANRLVEPDHGALRAVGRRGKR